MEIDTDGQREERKRPETVNLNAGEIYILADGQRDAIASAAAALTSHALYEAIENTAIMSS